MLLTSRLVCKVTYILVHNLVYRTQGDLQKYHGSVFLRRKKISFENVCLSYETPCQWNKTRLLAISACVLCYNGIHCRTDQRVPSTYKLLHHVAESRSPFYSLQRNQHILFCCCCCCCCETDCAWNIKRASSLLTSFPVMRQVFVAHITVA